jgi:hypothetical protein
VQLSLSVTSTPLKCGFRLSLHQRCFYYEVLTEALTEWFTADADGEQFQ